MDAATPTPDQSRGLAVCFLQQCPPSLAVQSELWELASLQAVHGLPWLLSWVLALRGRVYDDSVLD